MFNHKFFFWIAVCGSVVCAFNLLLPLSSEAHAKRKRSVTKQFGGVQSQESSSASQNPIQIPSLIKLQILLDRAGFSSGQIDGTAGTNVRKAISAFQDARGLPQAGRSDETTLQALSTAELTEPLVSYTIS